MHKTISLLIALLLFCFSGGLATKTNQPPDLDGMMIGEAFHQCKRCNSLTGGIHGKGPTKTFEGDGSDECIHEWIEIDSDTFRSTATELYGIDWAAEDAFYWNRKE